MASDADGAATVPCPICAQEMRAYPRYPRLICSACYDKTCDEKGRRVAFYNEGYWGGFLGHYVDTREKYDSHFCFVDGIECFADEGHTGGIAIERSKEPRVKKERRGARRA
jgi:hypothetical protein